ncbi:MAG: hypothetical protein POH28_04350 [Acidocella sp.]|nr:hypothetical protein [Acidocella sp.]
MKRLMMFVMLAVTAAPLAGCVVYPVHPPYARAIWVPGHFGPNGWWIRGHYA